MEKVLAKDALTQWVKTLEEYRVLAPIRDGHLWDYQAVDDPELIDLDYPNTIQSPKKIVFPQRETFLRFSNAPDTGLEINECLPALEATVVFGVRPCDARALTLTDKVFCGGFDDPYYQRRRDQTTLVGLACNTPPSPDCFCSSVDGSPHSADGLDVIMTDLDDRYFVHTLTPAGEAVVERAGDLFRDSATEDRDEAERFHAKSDEAAQRQIPDLESVPPKLNEMFESPFWDDESKSCIRCGICTYLCPTCHCFDVNDEVSCAAPLEGVRVRTWDTCQFPDFTMHSSGHNPRGDKASRLRQRIMHKFQYFVERYQDYQCTGCGRCITQCPVGIDIVDLLAKVSENGK